jgi:hypothetical protein
LLAGVYISRVGLDFSFSGKEKCGQVVGIVIFQKEKAEVQDWDTTARRVSKYSLVSAALAEGIEVTGACCAFHVPPGKYRIVGVSLTDWMHECC